MNNTLRWFVLSFLIIGLSFLLLSRNNYINEKTDINVNLKSREPIQQKSDLKNSNASIVNNNTKNSIKDANPLQRSTDIQINRDLSISSEQNETDTECLTYYEISVSDEWIEHQKWVDSWGGTTYDISSDGTYIPRQNIYEKHDISELERFMKAGNLDSRLLYALGKKYIERGYFGNSDKNDLSLVKEIPSSINDKQSLTIGRSILFEAAAHGHINSLTEIAFSYAFEKMIYEQSNNKTDTHKTKIRELELKILSYGELAEVLLNGVESSFFDSDSKNNFSQEEINQAISSELQRFNNKRSQLGYGEFNLETPESYYSMPPVCK